MPWRYVITQNLVEDCGRHILSDFAGELLEGMACIALACVSLLFHVRASVGIYVSSSGTGCEADASCFIPTLVEGNLGEGVDVTELEVETSACLPATGMHLFLQCATSADTTTAATASTRMRMSPGCILWGTRESARVVYDPL